MVYSVIRLCLVNEIISSLAVRLARTRTAHWIVVLVKLHSNLKFMSFSPMFSIIISSIFNSTFGIFSLTICLNSVAKSLVI